MHEFTRGGRGAEYVKVDLHVHTPGSHDYRDDISPEELVEALEDEELELVALTDHDCSGWYEEVVEAADDTDLEILPGVEITTHYGSERRIHVTAIFPPERAEDIDHVLSQIDINPADAENQHSDEDIEDICRTVRDHDGLPILAHIDERAGAHYEIERDNPIKDDLFNEEQIAALEIVQNETREEFDGFPFIKSSDAHELDEIGRGYTFMKMTEPSFEGLRTALADPGSRIALETALHDHPSIDGVFCDGEFLQDREIQLNKNLNCLIGGKGTGKSTVIEFIRYALDIEPRSERISEEYQNLIQHNLGDEGLVEIHVTAGNGEEYVIQREFEEAPIIYRADGEELEMDIQTFREEFFNPEIHSQRELLELARSEQNQLSLLDSYFDVDNIKEERDDLKEQLRQNARQLNEQVTEKNRLESELSGIQAVRETISVMEERGVDDHIDDQDLWEAEKRALNNTEEELETALEEAEALDISDQLNPIESIEESWPNQELIDRVSSLVEDATEEIENLEEQIVSEIEAKIEEVDEEREKWNERNSERRDEYEDLAEEIEEETGVDVDDYFDKKEKLERLEGLEDELEEVEEELQELETERDRLLAELETSRTELTDARRAGIAGLNDQLNDVRVELQPQNNKEEYIEWFDEVLQGSHVQTTYKEKVAEEYSPRRLAQIVRERDTERLEEEAEVTENTAQTIVNYEPLREKVFELEIMEVYDEPVIQINDGGWKSLDEMSDGQKCTALLSIAMVERETPLIIDQPEDMLDNDFIVSEVVKVLRKIKHNRQVLAVTHNANIPILGDAEQIVVMDSNGREAFFTCRGSIDDDRIKGRAQGILEGGEQAFRRRDSKYRRAP